jgi:hypothetical protein
LEAWSAVWWWCENLKSWGPVEGRSLKAPYSKEVNVVVAEHWLVPERASCYKKRELVPESVSGFLFHHVTSPHACPTMPSSAML